MADRSEDSDGSDEWGKEELVIPSDSAISNGDQIDERDDDDDYWIVEPESKEDPAKQATVATTKPSEPMIIVDMTQIDSSIHSKYDKNSVNDSVAVSTLRKTIESDYDSYSKDAYLLSEGTVIPCSSNVWRDALIRLRDERSGHYFAPIFPPKRKK